MRKRPTRQYGGSGQGNSNPKVANHLNENGPEVDGSDSDEVDVVQLKANFDDQKKIMAMVKEFETEYGLSKNDLNGFDNQQLEDDVTCKVVKRCYALLKESVYQMNPGFDSNKTGESISALLLDIQNCMKALCVLKGEYISINDLIINKDIMSMKVENVKKAI